MPTYSSKKLPTANLVQHHLYVHSTPVISRHFTPHIVHIVFANSKTITPRQPCAYHLHPTSRIHTMLFAPFPLWPLAVHFRYHPINGPNFVSPQSFDLGLYSFQVLCHKCIIHGTKFGGFAVEELYYSSLAFL